MEKLVIRHEDWCKNCEFCIRSCPKGALSAAENRINAKGYPPVQVDYEKCIACGVCFNVCPDYVFEIAEVSGNG
ncbi:MULTISPECIES: 4Fe-4S binding protein [Oscillospiraceae]|uniref:4Fe-4S binding protein n=1 Tax=Lawsonibacter faecis TaxID=2763052 RepID=A0A8J6MG63_9FIRM|nr:MULTISPECIES: 4Fe-4S binding protein [Oscillospiraceae]MTQ98267.1 4Fe-4S dicluster domain-containing protein [Pseudoflavonifractor sp. BIOML-A16]MTR07952.1 4Fe-4S dicluster domain-containing protein [Pseudoflavonifractor sp. BIOML-A15]MTR33976.1 4Fe-4S dicluster domain-containing protein [Pseudoflavonifractor sp. BIOML-A14]MTR74958.1 4Fe-4S dicluster domain-containing protein [Pseudoflavonifractor sp. BIOML-A18]MTS65750.1 4Fe-4S dicluster domain-containing protein [Pseudoflavonifractor sp. 